MARGGGRAWIGVSGYDYPHWVYVYFDNDHMAYAPHDAIGLRERVERRLAALTA